MSFPTMTTGDLVSAADWNILRVRSNVADLTNDSPGTAGVFEQFGTEMLTFSNLGNDVAVKAWLIASANGVDLSSAQSAEIRTRISIDGGSTWASGVEAITQVENTASGRLSMLVAHQRLAGTPSGEIQVQAQLKSSGTNMKFERGQLMAEVGYT